MISIAIDSRPRFVTGGDHPAPSDSAPDTRLTPGLTPGLTRGMAGVAREMKGESKYADGLNY